MPPAAEVDYSLDTLGVGKSVTAFPDQCDQVIKEISQQHIPPECYLAENVVISGMGGSALGGRIIANLERQTLKIPVVVSTEFHLPNFVNHKSLVVVSSYSGNTEETVASLAEAQARHAQIYILTSGGKLAQMAADLNLPNYVFNPVHNPSGQPRLGLGYNIVSLITLLSRCQLTHPSFDLGQLPDYLRSRQAFFPQLPAIAKQLLGRVPVLVSSEHLKGAAHGFKNQLNENAKTFAVSFDLPEMNHHLLEGLTFPHSNPDHLVFFFMESPKYHSEVLRRYSLTADVVKKNNIPVTKLTIDGPNRLFETLEMVQAGSYLAYYLALLNGVDPGPIPWVDWYKDEIRKVV